MKRTSTRTGILLLVAVCLLTAPAAGAHTAVVSSHTTDTDFQAGTLSNVSVEGTGDSARVVYDANAIVDSFEDGDISEYSGATGSASVVSSPTKDGSNSLSITGSSSDEIHSAVGNGLSKYPEIGDNTRVWVNITTGGSAQWSPYDTGDGNKQAQAAYLDSANNEFGLKDDNTVVNSTSVTVATDTWYEVDFRTNASGDVVAVLYNEAGSELARVSADNHVTSREGVSWGARSDATVIYDFARTGQDQSQVGTYISANHSASRVTTGFTNLTLSNANATVTWEGSAGGSWNQVATQTYTTGGNKSLSLSGTSYTSWRVNVTFQNTSSGGTATLEGEGLQATTSSPAVDNSSASPQNTEVSSETVTLSINVSDGDFGTAQGDSVDVKFVVNDTVEGTDTLTANGTAELEYTADVLGGVEYYVWANDSFGHAQQSDTFTFSTPNRLSIYNETAPHDRVKGVSVNATITGTGTTVDLRQTSDGNYSLVGLPADEEYVFTVTAENYSTREIYIRDIYEQNSIYLLHDNATSVQNSITITDRTGRFSNDPAILVDRVINTSNVSGTPDNGPQWVTVGGDLLGAGGFYVIDLQESARYRFRVVNQQGDVRVLGGYTAKTAGEINLEIGSVTYDLSGDENSYEWDAELRNESTGAWTATFSYFDHENQTENITVTLKTRENGTVLNQTTFTNGPYGEVVYTVPLSNSTVENNTVVVEWSAGRNESVITGQRYLGASRLLDFPLSELWQTVAYAAAMLVIAFLVAAGAGVPPALVTLGIMSTFGVFVGLAPPELGFGATGLVLLLGAIYMVELPD